MGCRERCCPSVTVTPALPCASLLLRECLGSLGGFQQRTLTLELREKSQGPSSLLVRQCRPCQRQILGFFSVRSPRTALTSRMPGEAWSLRWKTLGTTRSMPAWPMQPADPHAHTDIEHLHYSERSARTGSILVARWSGAKPAIAATAAMRTATMEKVAGSSGWMP